MDNKPSKLLFNYNVDELNIFTNEADCQEAIFTKSFDGQALEKHEGNVLFENLVQNSFSFEDFVDLEEPPISAYSLEDMFDFETIVAVSPLQNALSEWTDSPISSTEMTFNLPVTMSTKDFVQNEVTMFQLDNHQYSIDALNEFGNSTSLNPASVDSGFVSDDETCDLLSQLISESDHNQSPSAAEFFPTEEDAVNFERNSFPFCSTVSFNLCDIEEQRIVNDDLFPTVVDGVLFNIAAIKAEDINKFSEKSESISKKKSNCSSIKRDHPYERNVKTVEKKLRKKEQNRKAASRYRVKKKDHFSEIFARADMLDERNVELKEKVVTLQTEIDYLKNLLLDVIKASIAKRNHLIGGDHQ